MQGWNWTKSFYAAAVRAFISRRWHHLRRALSKKRAEVPKFRIRRYENERDFGQVWGLHIMGLEDTNTNPGNCAWHDDMKNIESVYLNGTGEFLVGELGYDIVAIGGLQRIDKKTAEIKRMRVEKAHRGSGFGKAILRGLEHRAKSLGYRHLVLSTTVGQEAARRLYESQGYTENRRSKLQIKGSAFEVIYYEKQL